MWRQFLPQIQRGIAIHGAKRPFQSAGTWRFLALSQQDVRRGPTFQQTIAHIERVNHNLVSRRTAWRACHLSTDTNAGEKLRPDSKQPTQPEAPKRRLSDDIKEYKERAATGSTASFDSTLIASDIANVFPRIKTTSLSTKRIVIHDEAMKNAVTLVLVAFRSFADDQLQSWRTAFAEALPRDSTQWYDVTINESFGAQALSGFIQRLHRSRTDPALHDFYVAFNSKAREPLEALLPSRNRMFGYVLLLDRHARVRFRASGMASKRGLDAMISSANAILAEDSQKAD